MPGLEENRRWPVARLGLACDAKCLFCNVPVESYSAPASLSPAAASAAVRAAAASGRVALSGGEPSLRKDLAALIREARAAGAEFVELQSNGISLAAKGRAAKLREAGLTHAFVGLHAHRAELHDFLVRRKGAFAACVKSVRALAEAGVEVLLNPVLTTVQYRKVEDYIRFAAGLPVTGVSLSVVQPHGRAWTRAALVPRYGDLAPFVERALAEADRLGVRVANPYCGLPLCVGGWHRRLDACVEHSEAALGIGTPDRMKFHPETCGPCRLRGSCGGVWRRYAALHPLTDLKPIA